MFFGIRSHSGPTLSCLLSAARSSAPPSASGIAGVSMPALPLYFWAIGNCLSPDAYTAVKSRLPPVQRLESVPPSSAEQKQRPLKRIHLELGLYQSGQSINASPQICVSAGDIHRAAATKIVQHNFVAWRIACSVA